jgi:hypothetical protein
MIDVGFLDIAFANHYVLGFSARRTNVGALLMIIRAFH